MGGSRRREIVELEHVYAFGPFEPFDDPVAEIAQSHTGRQLVLNDAPERARQQDLRALRRRANGCRQVNGDPDVDTVADACLTRMKSHPHPHRNRLRPLRSREQALRVGRRRNRRPGAAKDGEEPVALTVDFDPAVPLEHRA